MKDYIPLIEKIRERKARFGDSFQTPATPTQIEFLQSESIRNLDYKVPDDYVTFLRSMNGLNWNGFTVYSSEPVSYADDESDDRTLGFIENNLLLWRVEHAKGFIYFGETGHSLYTYDTKTKLFASNDRASLDVYATHESFSDMLYSVLETSLL